jgi:hypothetical protein
MNVDDETWQRLSAFHDGELDRDATAAVTVALRNDPILQSALKEISEMSAALKPLAPVKPGLVKHSLTRHWVAPGAIAALAASMLILVGLVLLERPEPNRTPMDWHRTFAAQSYQTRTIAGEEPALRLISHTYDLSSANLTLVDVALLESGDTYLHYTGVNGCRLTVASFPGEPVFPKHSSAVNLHQWVAGNVHYAILAEGMDVNKFSAIAQLLEVQTRGNPGNGNVVVAVRETTANAVPCA